MSWAVPSVPGESSWAAKLLPSEYYGCSLAREDSFYRDSTYLPTREVAISVGHQRASEAKAAKFYTFRLHPWTPTLYVSTLMNAIQNVGCSHGFGPALEGWPNVQSEAEWYALQRALDSIIAGWLTRNGVYPYLANVTEVEEHSVE